MKKLSFLALEDLKDWESKAVLAHFEAEYTATPEQLKDLEVLVAYESVVSWGCDSSSWFLLRNTETGQLFEVSGSHCSCFGFEDQFKPEPTTVEYLKSEKFSFSCGGYDSTRGDDYQKPEDNLLEVRAWIAKNL